MARQASLIAEVATHHKPSILPKVGDKESHTHSLYSAFTLLTLFMEGKQFSRVITQPYLRKKALSPWSQEIFLCKLECETWNACKKRSYAYLQISEHWQSMDAGIARFSRTAVLFTLRIKFNQSIIIMVASPFWPYYSPVQAGLVGPKRRIFFAV